MEEQGNREEEDDGESIDSEEEHEVPSLEDARKDLCESLDAIRGTGSFACFGAIAKWVDPVLSVDGSGPVTLPLDDASAQRIIAASHRAPFGKGTETIADTTVRRTWEIDLRNVAVNSPHWNGILGEALQGARPALGLVGQRCQALPYKLLLYEKRALFKPHTE